MDDYYSAMENSTNDGSIELRIAGAQDNQARTEKQAATTNNNSNTGRSARRRRRSTIDGHGFVEAAIVEKYEKGVRCWNRLLPSKAGSHKPYRATMSILMLIFTIMFTSLLIWNIEDDNMILSDPILWVLLSFSFLFSTIWSVYSRRIHCCCCNSQNNVKNKRCCCLHLICDCMEQCSLTPFWAVLCLLLSISTFVCSALGFIDYFYNETITVHGDIFSEKINLSLTNRSFGECIILSIISIICLIISTFGFHSHCPCCKYIVKFWGFVSLYVTILLCVWDIVSDILAALKVYVYNDPKFFWVSISFGIITFCFYHLFAVIFSGVIDCDKPCPECCCHCDCNEVFSKEQSDGVVQLSQPVYTRWMFFIPVLSMVPTILEKHVLSMIALAFSSFPQYIIALSFILEHGILNTFNVLALVMSLIQLLTSPFITLTMWQFRESNLSDEEEGMVFVFVVFLFLLYLVVLFPVILLEIIHFCPILFEYYMYQGIDYDDLVRQLLYFNIPKLLFLIVPIFMLCGGYCCYKGCIDEKNNEKIQNEIKKTGKKWDINVKDVIGDIAILLMLFIAYSLCFLVLPLIPMVIGIVFLTGMVAAAAIEMEKIFQEELKANKPDTKQNEKEKSRSYEESNDKRQLLLINDDNDENISTKYSYKSSASEKLLFIKKHEQFEHKAAVYSLSCGLRIVWITLLVYIVLAYGSMGTMLWTVEGGVGPITYAMLMTTWGLSAYMLLTPILIPLFVVIGIAVGVTCCKLGDADDENNPILTALLGFYYLMQNLFCNCCFPCKYRKEIKQWLSEQ